MKDDSETLYQKPSSSCQKKVFEHLYDAPVLLLSSITFVFLHHYILEEQL